MAGRRLRVAGAATKDARQKAATARGRRRCLRPGLLQFSLATHPYTYYLAAAALRAGQFLCMHYKGQFNRPRPGRLDPSLMPQIDPPGHSAYPSGHSLQSFLIAHCLEQVVPTVVVTAPLVGFFLLAQKAFIEGITMTGLKG